MKLKLLTVSVLLVLFSVASFCVTSSFADDLTEQLEDKLRNLESNIGEEKSKNEAEKAGERQSQRHRGTACGTKDLRSSEST